jgi:hypothetical protein
MYRSSVTYAAKTTAQETSGRVWVVHDSFARSHRNFLIVASLERGINFEMYLCWCTTNSDSLVSISTPANSKLFHSLGRHWNRLCVDSEGSTNFWSPASSVSSTSVAQSPLNFSSMLLKNNAGCSAARTNVVLRIVMSTITVVWLVSSLPLYFYTMTSHRDIYIYNC